MKRRQVDLPSIVKDVNVIMVDIEGTTTSINFVKVMEDVAEGVAGSKPLPAGGESEREDLIAALVTNILGMMDADRKVTPLKTLQGHMWRKAYRDGTITGHVYEDAVEALKAWKKEGKKLVVYSSGSVQAQKLLFGYSCYGDLLHYFSQHFDTTVGSKVETESYLKILRQLHCGPDQVLFLTDLVKEARAATEAGLKVILSVREGTAALTPQDRKDFPVITSFGQLLSHPAEGDSPPAKKRAGKEKKEGEEKEEEDKEGEGKEVEDKEGEEKEDGDKEGEEKKEEEEDDE
ncbi:enolase-phosphatase E1-like isoform X2 [Homarus americanus]|uniref:enolase-phosphatase E1-like isoform X2 n=1 Tax=Homarus americanus TaxID=6706 RepID=UPI001C47EEA4|nr:enolase-phosphatase E1-like isoform X2 [Homarus americanus]